MKKVLILYPHFPPSNLAGVHRPRLFAQHLPSFGWQPIILTVHEKYYEENPDWNLVKLLPKNLRIEKVTAFKITKPRVLGDIGLRAFFQLFKKAKQIIQAEKIDLLYIPIPSFYCALLGRWLHESTAIRYGIDYIDPWVHVFPGSNKWFSRHWVSTHIARFLEPIAVKKASLITGVSAGYYKGVIERNAYLQQKAITGAMPYGGEISDHETATKLGIKPYLFNKNPGKIQLVYAGAMLPKAYQPLEAVFKAIQQNPLLFSGLEIHFIGTGKLANDPASFNIKQLATQYNLWQSVVYEYPQRIPYLDVLVHLQNADGIFILGSTEPHYTPSKIYQAILAGRPILAILHHQCTVAKLIQQAEAGLVLTFDGIYDVGSIQLNFKQSWQQFIQSRSFFKPDAVKKEFFNPYSAEAVTKQLAILFDEAIVGG